MTSLSPPMTVLKVSSESMTATILCEICPLESGVVVQGASEEMRVGRTRWVGGETSKRDERRERQREQAADGQALVRFQARMT